ncbi:MAG: ABC transporter ATP-binding protein [Geminicoccaceae bacterium]
MIADDPDCLVHLDGIRKTFGRTVAVENLDIRIRRGEFVTFLGPSGCGKTTTLRMLGGFEIPDKGRILLDGRDVTREPPNRRNVNMVFQDYALFPHMTARQNIAFGLELKGMSRQQIDARTAELSAFLELDAHIDRYPDQLSGGQRQRMALARALAPNPSLLLLDEPLAALDAKLRGQVQQELKSIQRRTGKTFFFVTHDQDEALTMSDRIVVMNHGRVEQSGTPEELYHRPATRFVADFLGETNLIEARVKVQNGGETILDWNGRTLRGHSLNGVPGPDETVSAAIRLESLIVSIEPLQRHNVLQGRLANPVFKGSRIAVEIAIDGFGKPPLRTYLLAADMPANLDQPVWIGFDADRLNILRD